MKTHRNVIHSWWQEIGDQLSGTYIDGQGFDCGFIDEKRESPEISPRLRSNAKLKRRQVHEIGPQVSILHFLTSLTLWCFDVMWQLISLVPVIINMKKINWLEKLGNWPILYIIIYEQCRSKAKSSCLERKLVCHVSRVLQLLNERKGSITYYHMYLRKIIWSVAVLSGFVFLSDVAHLMWFERLYVWLQSFEKYILYPAIILNALTMDAFSISNYRRLGTQ